MTQNQHNIEVDDAVQQSFMLKNFFPVLLVVGWIVYVVNSLYSYILSFIHVYKDNLCDMVLLYGASMATPKNVLSKIKISSAY